MVKAGSLLVALVLAGCSPSSIADGLRAAEDFPDVSCTIAYRDDVDVAPSQERVALSPGEQQTLEFEQLVIVLTYQFDAGEGGSLLVDASLPDGGALIARDLYQFVPDDPPRNDFGGGHGFTGLNYIYPPGTTAEGQFLCTVDEPL